MKSNGEMRVFNISVLVTIIFTIILSLILFILKVNNHKEIISLIIGVIPSIIVNYWNYAMKFHYAKTDYEKLKYFTPISYILRFIVMALAIILPVVFGDNFSPLLIFVGLIEYPLFINLVTIINLKGGKGV